METPQKDCEALSSLMYLSNPRKNNLCLSYQEYLVLSVYEEDGAEIAPFQNLGIRSQLVLLAKGDTDGVLLREQNL
jgi:hypothetical protein